MREVYLYIQQYQEYCKLYSYDQHIWLGMGGIFIKTPRNEILLDYHEIHWVTYDQLAEKMQYLEDHDIILADVSIPYRD